jgi:hypothetical protein
MFTIDSNTVETEKIKAFEDGNGNVVIEDKVNDTQITLNDDVSMADVASHIVADGNPHATTLEQARSEDNQLSGPVDADGNDVENVGAVDVDQLDNDIHLRAQATAGSGTSDDPYDVDESVIDGRGGLVRVGEGWFETEGFVTDPTLDYSDDDGVYFLGYGPHVSVLKHVDGTSPVIKINSDSGGNFSGAYRLQVFGDGRGVGNANLIENSGDTIDSIWSHVYARYGGGDAMRLGSSVSGSRVHNCWLETCSGYGLNMVGGGTRCKVSNCHIVGNNAGQVYADVNKSGFTNLTLDGGGAGILLPTGTAQNRIANVQIGNVADEGIRVNGRRNYITNIHTSGPDIAVRFDGNGNHLSNLVSNASRQWGIFINGRRNQLANIHIDGGRSDLGSIQINNDRNQLSNILIFDSDNEGGYGLYISGFDRNYVNGLYYAPSVDKTLQIDNASTENVIDNLRGLAWSDITDDGERTLINRWGTNDGDPSAGNGEWRTSAGYAATMGATVWDTTKSPWRPYKAQPDGSNWIAIN